MELRPRNTSMRFFKILTGLSLRSVGHAQKPEQKFQHDNVRAGTKYFGGKLALMTACAMAAASKNSTAVLANNAIKSCSTGNLTITWSSEFRYSTKLIPPARPKNYGAAQNHFFN